MRLVFFKLKGGRQEGFVLLLDGPDFVMEKFLNRVSVLLSFYFRTQTLGANLSITISMDLNAAN